LWSAATALDCGRRPIYGSSVTPAPFLRKPSPSDLKVDADADADRDVDADADSVAE